MGLTIRDLIRAQEYLDEVLLSVHPQMPPEPAMQVLWIKAKLRLSKNIKKVEDPPLSFTEGCPHIRYTMDPICTPGLWLLAYGNTKVCPTCLWMLYLLEYRDAVPSYFS